ncbi:virginiamycin B lyase family protein [Bythopirellula polymerisocia]|uniref:Serine/threonine-protein kinase PknD n=1 Tax=Bythopirellula polymerisocia TaxID=2528003 RepID=A0A5C6CVD3_9BACT|nr:SMP-30/gluconolactonase/LRE family protein [Bythopirellula polymerisocia]TWU27401.1 Serine/threonine-protein kinase PknD [Bythopirellula polymerisocia]
MKSLKYGFVWLGVLYLVPEVAYGQTFWTAGIGDWNTAANWTLGVPNAASGTAFDAVIANGGTAQLTAPGGSVRRLRVGLASGPGSLVVDGGALAVTENLHLNEGSSGPASVTVQNGATVTSPSTIVGFSSVANTNFLISGAGTTFNAATQFIVGHSGAGTASLTVDSGAVLTSQIGYLGNLTGSRGVGVVRNPGSSWSTAGQFAVGNLGVGTLTIEDQGLVSAGTNLFIAATSNVNLNGGTLRFNTISGITRLNYNAGTIQLAGNRDIILDSGLFDFYGVSRIITSGKGLSVEGTTTIRQDKSLTVSGGTFASQGLLTLGAPGLSSGDLFINIGGTVATGGDVKLDAFGIGTISDAGSSWTVAGSFQVSPTGGRGDLFISNQASLYIGNTLSIGSSGFVTLNGGTIRFDGYSRNPVGAFTYSAGTVQLAGNRTIGSDAAILDLFGASPTIPTGKVLVVEGTAILTAAAPVTLSGGDLAAETVLMSPGSQITNAATAQVSGGMLALAGSVIDGTGGDLTMGDAAKVNGFYCAGTLQVGLSTVTLNDANDAVLDSAALVTLGSGGNPGTLVAANGLTLNFGGNITGFGTVDMPDDPAKPFINNGNLTGDSLAEPLTLAGYVKGVGTYDNVAFAGTFSPGFSPAKVNLGSASYNGTLEIEIGGLSPGSSGYDQVNHILGDGIAELGGTLEVSLLGAFEPVVGNSFEVLTAVGGVLGTFTDVVLPSLEAGLSWSLLYEPNAVLLSVVDVVNGDFDLDGDIDGRDFLVWQRGGSPNPFSSGDLALWQTEYNGGLLAATSVAVPEPASWVLLLAAACLLLRIGKRGIESAASLHARVLSCPRVMLLLATITLGLAAPTARADIFYFSSQGAGRHIVEVNSAGAVSVFASLPVGAAYASGVAFDQSGNLYTSDPNRGTISKITTDGTVSLFKSGLSSPQGLAFDESGDLYVANNGANQINKITHTGTLSLFAMLPAGSESEGLAFDGNGNLYVARSNANQINKVTPDGMVSLFATLPADSLPFGLAFDDSGILYETGLDNQIRKITPGGAVSLFASLPNYTVPSAVGLAFDSSGNLYAAGLSGEISKITPDGTVSLFATATNESLLYIAVTDDLGNPLVLPPNGLAGDFDFDGDVDGRDFLVWQRGGSTNGINSGDLADWQTHYGTPLVATSVAVPEPGSILSVVTSALIPLLRSRKSRLLCKD